MPTESEPWYKPWANGSREVTSCTTDEHDPLWLRIEAISTEISAKTNIVPFQSHGLRTNEFDHKFSVFEPEPEPYRVLPGIAEVLFAAIEELKTEVLEGKEDEGDTPGIGGQYQQEDSRQVRFCNPTQAIAVLTGSFSVCKRSLRMPQSKPGRQ